MRKIREHFDCWYIRKNSAITLWLFGMYHLCYGNLKENVPIKMRRHERVHIEQIERYRFPPWFYIQWWWYLVTRGYRNIPSEVEAYRLQTDAKYNPEVFDKSEV